MTKLCLTRHAATAEMENAICGRAPGIRLSAQGRRQACQLALALLRLRVSAIYSSPLERAFETAALISAQLDLDVRINEALVELDYGEWTGAAFDRLKTDARWQLFNSNRSTGQIPGGESIVSAQSRILDLLKSLRIRHRDQTIVIVTHAELIRLALCHYASIPLDRSPGLEIKPASACILFDSGQTAWLDDGESTPGIRDRRLATRSATFEGAAPCPEEGLF